MDANMTSYLSRSALVSAVDQPVPDPSLPDRFSFTRGQTLGNGSFVWTIYQAERDVVQVQRLDEPVSIVDSNRTATVGPHEGLLTRARGQWILEWRCSGATYVLYGSMNAFDRAALVDVAESVECR